MNPYTIKRPVITEKSLKLANTENVYTFLVDRNANKNQIRVAVEELFLVSVEAVNTIMNAKSRKKTGKKRKKVTIPKTKKALVKLKEGDNIKLFDIGGEA